MEGKKILLNYIIPEDPHAIGHVSIKIDVYKTVAKKDGDHPEN